MSLTPPPTAPSRSSASTFVARMNAFLAWIVTFIAEMNLAIADIAAKYAAVLSNAATASSKAAEAAASATAAAVNAPMWVSGNYNIGVVVWSPIDFMTYRARTTGAKPTDPSLDPTNWGKAFNNFDNATLTGTTQVAALVSSGAVQTKYGDFSSPGVIVGDAQYGMYVAAGGWLAFKNSSSSIYAFRNISDTGDYALISSSGATISGAVVGLSGNHSFKGNFSLICADDSTAVYMSQGIVNAAGESAANSSLWLRKDSTTSRSISAAGTLNGSGADGAEYERNNGLVIAKGDVVGFGPDGTLTASFADAIRFGIKSTAPNIVGGDTWGSEDKVGARPVKPLFPTQDYVGTPAPAEIPAQPSAPVLSLPASPVQQPGETAATIAMRNAAWQQQCADVQAAHDVALVQYSAALAEWQSLKAAYDLALVQHQADMAAHSDAVAAAHIDFDTVIYPAYQAALAAFEVRLEAARQAVDRIAYFGKVPVNVLGAMPGDYLIAVASADGSITATPVADPTFAQYRFAIGRVNRVLADGRAEVAVIVH